MGHECKNTEVGVGRDAQVEVIPWTMGRGVIDLSMEFDRKIIKIHRGNSPGLWPNGVSDLQ